MEMVDARCVRSSITYGRENRLLLPDVGLKFERAAMQIIRWMCDFPEKTGQVKNWLELSLSQLSLEMVCCIPRQYVFSCDTILPAKYVFMKSDANKIQLKKCIYTVCINTPHLHMI